MGDPVDTFRHLVSKLAICDEIAVHWKKEGEDVVLRSRNVDIHDRTWKALALITDAYQEWDRGKDAIRALQPILRKIGDVSEPERDIIVRVIHQTADALAADRATKFLPIIVAVTFFVATIAIAVGRTASAAAAIETRSLVFINVEAHSIAFSALYYWILPTVILGSIIGVSQTDAAIPRILKRFQADLDREPLTRGTELPDLPHNEKYVRKFNGGIYSWLPAFKRLFQAESDRGNSAAAPLLDSPSHPNVAPNRRRRNLSPTASRAQRIWQYFRSGFLPNIILVFSVLTAILISALVPPEGWGCRNIGQVSISCVWLLSAQLDQFTRLVPFLHNNEMALLWIIGIKDLLATLLTMGGIVITQIGIFNQCACYTKNGRTGLPLPEMPEVAKVLMRRLNTTYPAISFAAIGIQLIIIPSFVLFRCRHAVRVYLQRDEDKSNARWVWELYDFFLPQRRRCLSRPTFETEEGRHGNNQDEGAVEMHDITDEPETIVQTSATTTGFASHRLTASSTWPIEGRRA
ncbi:MAG: hypothetical protein Q9167_000617 [Letrouitia subvulpina]